MVGLNDPVGWVGFDIYMREIYKDWAGQGTVVINFNQP